MWYCLFRTYVIVVCVYVGVAWLITRIAEMVEIVLINYYISYYAINKSLLIYSFGLLFNDI